MISGATEIVKVELASNLKLCQIQCSYQVRWVVTQFGEEFLPRFSVEEEDNTEALGHLFQRLFVDKIKYT